VNALTATVRVSASDRPGLLQDVADAINQVGLSVESADVNTHMDLYAINTYIVKIAECSKLTFMGNGDAAYSEDLEDNEFEEMIVDSTLAQKLKEAILGQALSKSKKALADRIASSESAVPTVPQEVEPSVEVSLLAGPDQKAYGIVVKVTATDFPGILASITSGFDKLNLSVRSARVTTTDKVIANRFVLNYDEKANLDAIKEATLAAVNSA